MNIATRDLRPLLMDIGERSFCALLYAPFAMRFLGAPNFDIGGALVLISETLTFGFVLFRKPTKTFSQRPFDWLIALAGTCLPLLLRPSGAVLAPVALGAALMILSLSFAIWAKLTLRRSFGLAAANRGSVLGGPYRIVRHPMYAGYFGVYAGFILTNASLRNAAIVAGAITFQVMRARAEERILSQDADYRQLLARVRHRFVPGLI